MKIKLYQAGDGDCLLVQATGGSGSRMLVDGGRKGTWREFTAPDLEGEELDLVVVSHIDNDHISGVVELFDRTVEWKVYRRHEERLERDRDGLSGEELTRRRRELRRLRPDYPEPPSAAAVWHNAFTDQVSFESSVPFAQSQVDDLLTSAMRMQLLDRRFAEELEDTANVAQGVKEALILRNRLGPDQLDVPVNGPARRSSLLFLGDESGGGSVGKREISVGDFAVRILGPSRDDLVRLEEEWNDWVEENAEVARELRREAQLESERLDAGHALELPSVLAALAERLGDGSTITPPNLASLLLLVEQNDRSVLLTGDGNASEILRGLRAHRLLAAEGADDGGAPQSVHVDVLKMPHHGATDNIDADDFFSLVTADHYLFCGNGAHHNPESVVVERLMEIRGGLVGELGPYELWFSSSSSAANSANRKAHMAMLEELVAGADGCTAHFLDQAFFEIDPAS